MTPLLITKEHNNIVPHIIILKVFERELNNNLWGYVYVEVVYDELAKNEYSSLRHEQSITIYFSRIDKKPTNRVSLTAWYDKSYFSSEIGGEEPTICLTNEDVILRDISYRGRRLGTWAMNQIVLWAKQWPDARVRPIRLSGTDALDVKNKIRRNKFYEHHGIKFDYYNQEKEAGKSEAMLSSSLKMVDTWDKAINPEKGNIEVLEIPDFINALMKENGDLKSENKNLTDLNNQLNNTFFSKVKKFFV